MRALDLRLAATALLTMALPGTARATTYQVCVDYQVDFEDAESRTGDDFITDNSNRNATGVRVQIINAATATVVEDEFTSDGSSPGCIDFDLTPRMTYNVRILSIAEVNDNTIRVWNNDTDNTLYAQTFVSWVPYNSGDITVVTDQADQWNIMAASSFAMSRNNAGLTGKTLTFYTQKCPGGSSCIETSAGATQGRVYICPTGGCDATAENKSLIGHEMGHWIAYRANVDGEGENQFGNPDGSWNGGLCGSATGHGIASEEYQSLAAPEGIAYYWAALAFNSTGDDDCVVNFWRNIDWDHDSSVDGDLFSCEDAPIAGQGWADEDFHDDICSGGDDRGTEYDWLRFWWDFTTDESMAVEEVYEVWDLADPHDWNGDGSDASSELFWGSFWAGSATHTAFTNQWVTNGVYR